MKLFYKNLLVFLCTATIFSNTIANTTTQPIITIEIRSEKNEKISNILPTVLTGIALFAGFAEVIEALSGQPATSESPSITTDTPSNNSSSPDPFEGFSDVVDLIDPTDSADGYEITVKTSDPTDGKSKIVLVQNIFPIYLSDALLQKYLSPPATD